MGTVHCMQAKKKAMLGRSGGKSCFQEKKSFPHEARGNVYHRDVSLSGDEIGDRLPLFQTPPRYVFFFFPRSSCSQRGKKVLMMSLQKCWTTFRPLADSQRWVHRGVNGCGRNGQSASQPPVRPRPLSRQRPPPLATARPHPIVSSWINALARKADPRNKNS